MSTWGYVSSGLAISLGLFSFISSLLCIVVLKGSPTTTLRTATENFTLFMVVISVGVLVVACISCWKIYNSHKLYIDVAAGAVGKVGTIKVVDSSGSNRSVLQNKAQEIL